jgi:hypothetical protein
MLMFTMHIAYSLLLLVLLAAVSLLIWSLRSEGTGGAGIAKFFGSIVSVLAIFGVACMLYYSLMYWQKGAFKSVMPMQSAMHEKMMMGGE